LLKIFFNAFKFVRLDLFLVPQVYNAKRFGVEMSSFPRISEVAARLEAIEEFKAAHPSMQPDAAN